MLHKKKKREHSVQWLEAFKVEFALKQEILTFLMHQVSIPHKKVSNKLRFG